MTTEETTVRKTDTQSTEADRYDLIRWRRERVLALRAKGYTIDRIVQELKAGHPDVAISHGTVVNDLKVIKEEVNQNLSRYVQEDLPFENAQAIAGIKEVIRQSWELAEKVDGRDKLSAMALAKDGYLTLQALLGDAKVLEQAVQWMKRAKKQLEEKA